MTNPNSPRVITEIGNESSLDDRLDDRVHEPDQEREDDESWTVARLNCTAGRMLQDHEGDRGRGDAEDESLHAALRGGRTARAATLCASRRTMVADRARPASGLDSGDPSPRPPAAPPEVPVPGFAASSPASSRSCSSSSRTSPPPSATIASTTAGRTFTETGRQARLAFVDRWEARLAGLDDATLDRGERIDRDLVLGELARSGSTRTSCARRRGTRSLGLHPGRRDPPAAGPRVRAAPRRLASVAARLEGIPAVIAAAQQVMGTHPTRPVSRLQAEVAAKRIGGVTELARRGRRGRRGGGAPATRRSRRCCRGCGPRPTPRRRRSTRSARHLAARSPAAAGQPAPRARPVRGQAAAHAARPGR